MFEAAELGHKIDDNMFKRKVGKLREALLDAQYDLLEKRSFSLIVLINGVDGAGKGETVNVLNEWMDPRHIRTEAFGPMSEEERRRPRMWRFWISLPPKGKTGILFGSWYSDPILDRAYGRIDKAELEERIAEIVRFERMLTAEGALLVKLWFHLSKAAQKKRLRALERDKRTRWRVSEQDWEHFEKYDKFRKLSEHVLRETSTGEAPWTIIEGADANYRSLTVGNVLLGAMKRKLADGEKGRGPLRAPPQLPDVDERGLLRALDMETRLSKAKYEVKLEKLQRRLNLLSREPKFQKLGVVAVFEGMDAAGKGGTIRRITPALDARHYRIIPVAAPTDEERAQPYLWRFWRHIPKLGTFTMFDRSWYGRVLVERIEGFCAPQDWMRAYNEINDFEQQLVDHGLVLAKFWLQITKDEQLARFKEREATGFKQYKITPEDWRNRKKWDDYERAASDMVERTSTEIAPWTLVPANDKHVARIMTLETLCDRIEEAL
jgi:polyphosphate:AMP phosphotransferase